MNTMAFILQNKYMRSLNLIITKVYSKFQIIMRKQTFLESLLMLIIYNIDLCVKILTRTKPVKSLVIV